MLDATAETRIEVIACHPHEPLPQHKKSIIHEVKIRPGPEILRALPLFSSLNDEHVLLLNEAGDLARVGPNEEVLRQGQVSPDLIFLISGYLAVSHVSPGEQRRLVDVVVPTSPISCAESFTAAPAPFGYQTITSVRLILIPILTIRTIMQQDVPLAQAFNAYLLSLLVEKERELYDLKLSTTAQRLAQYLLDLADTTTTSPVRFVLPFEKRFLAGKIGCTQESLSRTFALLRRQGVETAQNGAVVIRDVARLRAFATHRRHAEGGMTGGA